MVTQNYTISTVKSGTPPKVKMSQYDYGMRTITFAVVDGSGDAVNLTGKTVTVEGTRLDGHAFASDCTVEDNTATFIDTVDMTNAAGDHPAELVIRENDERLATMNFVISVEPAAMDEDAEITPEDRAIFDQLYEKLASGSPATASTVAAMTDTDAVYLYTGSETGYVNGNWYYYNGTAWVSGGTYGGSSITVDDALSDTSTNPVQNKVITAEVSSLKSDLGQLEETKDEYLFSINLFDYDSPDNESGYIINNGLVLSNPNYKTSGFIEVKPNTKYYVVGGYKSPYGVRTVPFLLEYTADKTPSTYHQDVPYYFTTGATTKYVRFTYRVAIARDKVGISELEIPVNGIVPKYNMQVNARKTSVPQAQVRKITMKQDLVTANAILGNPGCVFSPRKNSRIVFSGNFSEFTNLTVGLTVYGGSDYNRLVIDSTKVTAYNYNGTTTEYTHGLTITNNIQVLLEIGFALNCNLTLVSNGVVFTQNNIRWDGKYNTYVYAKPNKAMTDCVLSWTSKDMNKSIWMFGDSYFGYTNHWAYFLNQSGYIDNCMMNAYSGEGSADAITALKTYLNYATPQIVVWCMGMNDGSDIDSTTPSSAWLDVFTELVNLSEIFGFRIVVATIPTVPTIDHVGQNYYVRNSGYDVIDFACAVGAQSDGTWFSGMLSDDGVHPSNTGARALFMRFLADFPEIMIDDN